MAKKLLCPGPMWRLLRHSLQWPAKGIFLFFLLTHTVNGEKPVGFRSLLIGVGGREAGMGNTGVSYSEGSFSFYFNPALPGEADEVAFGLTYTDWLLDTKGTGIGFIQPTKIVNFGFGLIYFDYGNLELRRDKPEEALGEYSPKDASFYFNLSRSLSQNFTFGTSLRYFYERLFLEEAKQWGLDLGLSYNWHSWRIGLSYLNWGDVLRLEREKFYLPTNLRFGISRSLFVDNFSFLFASDLSYSTYEGRCRILFGGEVAFKGDVFLRLGWNHFFPTFGLGIKRGIFHLDYSLEIKRELPELVHHFTLGFRS